MLVIQVKQSLCQMIAEIFSLPAAAAVAWEDPADNWGRLLTDCSKMERRSGPILSHNGTLATRVSVDTGALVDLSHGRN